MFFPFYPLTIISKISVFVYNETLVLSVPLVHFIFFLLLQTFFHPFTRARWVDYSPFSSAPSNLTFSVPVNCPFLIMYPRNFSHLFLIFFTNSYFSSWCESPEFSSLLLLIALCRFKLNLPNVRITKPEKVNRFLYLPPTDLV